MRLKCHTHKYDPLTHADYYRTMALLNNADEPEVDVVDPRTSQLRAELEQKIAVELADLPKRFPVEGNIRWHDVELVSAASAEGATLTRLVDGSILASGANPATDTYTLVLDSKLPRVSTIQIEALTYPTLGGTGPGRTPHGNFVLTEVAASFVPAGGEEGTNPAPTEIKFANGG